MKTIIQTIIVIIGFYFLGSLFSDDKPKKSSKIIDDVKIFEENKYSDSDNKTTPNIIIKGLGNVDKSDLKYASNIISEFFGYECKVSENVDVPTNILSKRDVIDAPSAMSEFDNNSIRTIYLTYEGLEENNVSMRGYTTLYGNSIIIRADRSFMKETLIHEIGHTLGLLHCDDLSCIMAINNDQYDSGDFCEKCKSKLNN